jgi:hypothetical protein
VFPSGGYLGPDILVALYQHAAILLAPFPKILDISTAMAPNMLGSFVVTGSSSAGRRDRTTLARRTERGLDSPERFMLLRPATYNMILRFFISAVA